MSATTAMRCSISSTLRLILTKNKVLTNLAERGGSDGGLEEGHQRVPDRYHADRHRRALEGHDPVAAAGRPDANRGVAPQHPGHHRAHAHPPPTRTGRRRHPDPPRRGHRATMCALLDL